MLMFLPRPDFRSQIVSGGTLICLAVLTTLSPAWAGGACATSQNALETFLKTQPNHCTQDADCDGYYFRGDSCAAAVVLAKPGVSRSAEPRLSELQAEARAACRKQWSQRPACSPVPFLARCRWNRCVDAGPSLSPNLELTAVPTEKGDYSFAVIRHECAPWDGPAMGIHLTKSKVTSAEIPFPVINLMLWRELPPPINQPITLDGRHFGNANRCLRANECALATSAVITLTAYDDRRVAGTYVLKFKNGDVEGGSFQAEWQDFHELCR
jgi:hypothetical protein